MGETQIHSLRGVKICLTFGHRVVHPLKATKGRIRETADADDAH